MSYDVYTDARFASERKDRRSASGYLITMAGPTVSWGSKKRIASLSLLTAQLELVALSERAKDSEVLLHLLSEMGFDQKAPIKVCCDSMAAISVVKNPDNHSATKHIEIPYLITR